jgi:hypothetical protein
MGRKNNLTYGEQYCNLIDHDVFESFDADKFEAAMICSIEPSPCMNEEETTTKDNGIIKALENAIVFFETFCLKDDFDAHAMDDDETSVSIAKVCCSLLAGFVVRKSYSSSFWV